MHHLRPAGVSIPLRYADNYYTVEIRDGSVIVSIPLRYADNHIDIAVAK